ncbi:MAG: prolipoprotein diacylglyceryl transferase [Acidobacteriota bacterium]
MHPVLFHLPFVGWPVPTYGVLLAIAFLVVLKVAGVFARRAGIDSKDMVDVGFTVFLAGLVGAKLLLILLDLPTYLAHPASLIGTIRSAGVFYGGLIAGVIAGIWIARRRGLPLWTVGDVSAICLPVGLAIGRLGCFAAGCCFGTPTDVAWAVTFTDPVANQNTGVPLYEPRHPVEIYMALNALALTAILLWRFKHRRFDGQVFLWFVVLYGATRSFWELFRGDAVRGFLIPGVLSTSQSIGLASVALGLIILWWRRSQATP